MVATSHTWPFTLTKIKQNVKISFSVTPVVFQMFKSHMWLMGTTWGSTDTGYFYHCRKFYWRALLKTIFKRNEEYPAGERQGTQAGAKPQSQGKLRHAGSM